MYQIKQKRPLTKSTILKKNVLTPHRDVFNETYKKASERYPNKAV